MSPPRGCTNLKLRQLTRLVTRHYEVHFSGSGLRITQYSLLGHVVALGHAGSGALAAAMQLSPSALTRCLRPLVQRGWVEVEPGADARSRVIGATAAGRAKREELKAVWKRAQLELNQRLGSERVAALHALLDEGIAALAHDGDDGDDGDDDEN